MRNLLAFVFQKIKLLYVNNFLMIKTSMSTGYVKITFEIY